MIHPGTSKNEHLNLLCVRVNLRVFKAVDPSILGHIYLNKYIKMLHT